MKTQWHGQDARKVCDNEGYGQMEWTGRFTSKTPFRFFRHHPDMGEYVSKWTDPAQLFATLEANREKLERFASNLKDIRRAPGNPSDALRLADSIDAYMGL